METREQIRALRQQWHALRTVILLLYTPVVIAFVIIIAIRIRTGIAIAEVTVHIWGDEM
jgi:hypothetical protein